jgi:hypothetical protein
MSSLAGWMVAAGLAVAVAAAPLEGQGWVVDAAAGSTMHEGLPGAGEAIGATLGIRREGSPWLYMAGGVPLASGSLPWAAAGAGMRLQSRVAPGFGIGLDAGGHVYGYSDASLESSGSGVTAEALPLVSFGRGPVGVELRSGAVHHRRLHDGALWSRTIHHTDVRAVAGAGLLRLIGEARYLRAEEGDYPYAGAAAELALGSATLWGSAGRWLADGLDESAWAAGGRWRVGTSAELHAAFRKEANDPLYWNGARTIWSVGVSRSLGRLAPAGGATAPPQVRGTAVEFRLPVSVAAEAPAVAGDFNGWEPVPMRREGDFWVVSLSMRPGLHRYAFRRANGEWFVPAGVPGRVDDGFGGESATVLVQ